MGFDDIGLRWSCTANSDVATRVRELDGITLALTSAINPPALTRLDQFALLLQHQAVSLGWIALAGTAERQALRERPAPDSLAT